MIRWTTRVKTRGPIFDGLAPRIVDRWLTDVVHEVGERGRELVRSDFDRVHRNPTGYARSQVAVDDYPGPRTTVGDGGIVYGPWLEGVGSRNRTTRFKGYATFRRIGQRLDAVARDIAERRKRDLVRSLNGGA